MIYGEKGLGNSLRPGGALQKHKSCSVWLAILSNGKIGCLTRQQLLRLAFSGSAEVN